MEGESPARSEAAVLAWCQKRQGRHPNRCRGLGCHNLCAHSHKKVGCVQAQLHIIMQAIRVWNQRVTYFTINRLLSFMWMCLILITGWTKSVPFRIIVSHSWMTLRKPMAGRCLGRCSNCSAEVGWPRT